MVNKRIFLIKYMVNEKNLCKIMINQQHEKETVYFRKIVQNVKSVPLQFIPFHNLRNGNSSLSVGLPFTFERSMNGLRPSLCIPFVSRFRSVPARSVTVP